MDFGDPEEDEGPEAADKATIEEEPPIYEDMDNGPLAGHGVSTVAKYMGAPRFRSKDGYYYYSYPLGATVTRVVAASRKGHCIICLRLHVPGSGQVG